MEFLLSAATRALAAGDALQALKHVALRHDPPSLALRGIAMAQLAEIERFRERMGWKFHWASSNGTTFNRDFHVSFTAEDRMEGGEVYYNYHFTAFPAEEAPGISVFIQNDAGEIFHTYSTFGRGVEVMMGAYALIDLTPKGRDEQDLPHTMAWVRHHDRYEPQTCAAAGCCGQPG